jgi:hypothetical protein
MIALAVAHVDVFGHGPAFRLNAPTVLFITLEIFETDVLDFG